VNRISHPEEILWITGGVGWRAKGARQRIFLSSSLKKIPLADPRGDYSTSSQSESLQANPATKKNILLPASGVVATSAMLLWGAGLPEVADARQRLAGLTGT
jgi:hypothetical protein